MRFPIAVVLLIAIAACQHRDAAAPLIAEASLRLVASPDEQSAEIGFPWESALSGDARVFVITDPFDRGVVVADTLGHRLGSLARSGDGPGELRRPVGFATKGDSVVVVDAAKAHGLLFGPDGEYIRTVPSPKVSLVGAIFLRGDSLITPHMVMEEERFGYPLQLLAPNGQVVMSFGADDRSVDPRSPIAGARILARASDSSVWVGRYDNFKIQEWSTAGKVIAGVRPNAPWMVRDSTIPWAPIDRVRPQPTLQSLYCCSQGRLLAIYQRPRSDWRPSADTSRGERPVMPVSDYLRYIEQVVVAIDPRSGRVVAEARPAGVMLGGFLRDGRLTGFVGMEDGRQLLTILRWQMGE